MAKTQNVTLILVLYPQSAVTARLGHWERSVSGATPGGSLILVEVHLVCTMLKGFCHGFVILEGRMDALGNPVGLATCGCLSPLMRGGEKDRRCRIDGE